MEAPLNAPEIYAIIAKYPSYPEEVISRYSTIATEYIIENPISPDILTWRIKCTYDNTVGWLWSWITAFWTWWEICYLNEDGKNLTCDNWVLWVLSGTIAQLIAMFRKTNQNTGSEYEFPGAIVSTTWANTWYYCSSTDWNTLECNNEVILWWDTILSWELWKRCRYWAIVNGVIKWSNLQEFQEMIQTGIICTNDEPGHWMINNTDNTVYTDYWLAIWTNTHSGYTLNVNWDWIIKESLAIWTDTNSGYLNVNWSWRIATKFNIWDDILISSSEEHYTYIPRAQCDPEEPRITSPTITYSWTLTLRDNKEIQCNNWYTEFGEDWKVWIGWPTETGTKLSIYGHTKIYSTQSTEDEYIELFNEMDYSNWKNVSNIISKWSDMRIWLTWDQDVLGVILPSSYIYFRKTNIWINKIPVASTRNNSTQQWYYSPTLQVSGSIQISSEYPISNNTQTINKMICNQQIEWTIAYYNGNFYGCAKTTTSGVYRRRSLNTSAVNGDSLPAVPSVPTS